MMSRADRSAERTSGAEADLCHHCSLQCQRVHRSPLQRLLHPRNPNNRRRSPRPARRRSRSGESSDRRHLQGRGWTESAAAAAHTRGRRRRTADWICRRPTASRNGGRGGRSPCSGTRPWANRHPRSRAAAPRGRGADATRNRTRRRSPAGAPRRVSFPRPRPRRGSPPRRPPPVGPPGRPGVRPALCTWTGPRTIGTGSLGVRTPRPSRRGRCPRREGASTTSTATTSTWQVYFLDCAMMILG
mmetsp:Transcript_26823/g.79265  ORF Transcript_26823/g.79265 Transcript_26823/m.79265 type:complete len:244 (-) Transcript_26823:74-805(-)